MGNITFWLLNLLYFALSFVLALEVFILWIQQCSFRFIAIWIFCSFFCQIVITSELALQVVDWVKINLEKIIFFLDFIRERKTIHQSKGFCLVNKIWKIIYYFYYFIYNDLALVRSIWTDMCNDNLVANNS